MPRRAGQWLILTVADIKRMGFNDFNGFAKKMSADYPLVIKNVGRPQIDSGVLFTTDPERAEHFISVLTVAKNLDELGQMLSRKPGA